LPREALEWIYGAALGNPLFSLEFFRFLARQGTLWNDGHRWRWRTPQTSAMPVTIEALIERMLSEAISTPVLERAMGARAVLGIEATPARWASVAELTPPALELVSADLERLGVLAKGDFAHPLYREVALGNVTLEERRSLARRALETILERRRVSLKTLDWRRPRRSSGFGRRHRRRKWRATRFKRRGTRRTLCNTSAVTNARDSLFARLER
jgi:hypothetical protein